MSNVRKYSTIWPGNPVLPGESVMAESGAIYKVEQDMSGAMYYSGNGERHGPYRSQMELAAYADRVLSQR